MEEGHAYGPRGRPCGAPRGGRGGWHVEGPRVSGPWLDFWGGNAICVNRPLIYRSGNFFHLPCGTMFPHGLSILQDAWRS